MRLCCVLIPHSCRSTLQPPLAQILYKVFEPSELQPVLDAVNADMTKEKEKEKK